MNNCDKCKWNHKSYHCMDCDSYDGNLDELESFCGYCNHNKDSHSCNNCVWYKL